MLEARLLGQFDLRLNGQPVDLASRPAQNLLAYLLLTPGQPHRREHLAALFWPDAPDANARSNLRHALWRLRNRLDPQGVLVRVDPQTITFNPDSDYWLDADVLQQEFAGDWPTEALVEAVSAYRGELLPGLYADWADRERERLRGVFERQAGLLLDRLSAEGRWADLTHWAERLLAVNRASEPAYRALMQAHAALGNLSGLASTYQRCIDSLRDELGLSPSAQTRRLYDQLLNDADRPVVTAPAAPPVAAPAPAPPAAAPPAAAPPPNNLPAQSTQFIGREDLLAEIAANLADPACRLLTLTGPGGIGKTRLSLQAANAYLNGQAAQFPDGVFFVPLAPVGSPDLIIPAIAGALAFTLYGGMDPREQLLNFLRDRQVLFVLDNFEHLVEGADAIGQIIEHAPRVKCLVSSRERLNLQGEWLLPVEGLRVPENESVSGLENYSAMRLFLQSARRVQAGFQLRDSDRAAAVRICRLVEGMPLALELASAWVRAVSLPEIAAEIERNLDFLSTTMRNLPQRHRSLRAVFDHSWALLTPEEQRSFARLSVFRGGFQREAAEAVAGASLPVLSAFMDKSLLRRNPSGRYEIHELLRQYARDKLTDSGEEAQVRNRHLAHYLHMAETAEPLLRRAEQIEWLGRLETEHDNLRVALKWAKTDEQIEDGLRLAGALTRFWYLHGYWQEGRDWLNVFLEMAAGVEAPSEQFQRARARALMGAGWLQDENGKEFDYYREALALCRAVGDRWGEALSLRGLGANLYFGPNALDREQASAHLRESHAIFESLNDPWGVGLTKFNIGWLAYVQDLHADNVKWWQDSLEAFRRSGDRWGIAITLGALSYSARYTGDYKGSAAMAKESLQMFREVGDRAGVADSLARLASVAYRRSDYKQAIEIYEESLSLTREIGNDWDEAQITSVIGLMRAYQGQFERADKLLEASLLEAEQRLGPEAAALVSYYKAIADYLQGHLDLARGKFEQSMETMLAHDDRLNAAYCRHWLGLIALKHNDLAAAENSLRESHAVLAASGDKRGVALAHYGLARLAQARGQTPEAISAYMQALRPRREMGDKLGVAEVVEGVAAVCAQADNPARLECAAEYLALAEQLREQIALPLPPVERAAQEDLIAGLQKRMGQAAYSAAHERGRGWPLSEALNGLMQEME